MGSLSQPSSYKRAEEKRVRYIAELNAEIVEALKTHGEDVCRDAQTYCPVDTGALKNSIHYDMEVTPGSATLIVLADASRDGEGYADFVEYGTGIHRETGDGRTTPWSYKDDKGKWHTTRGQKPQPFMRPATIKHLGELKKALERLGAYRLEGSVK